MGKWSFAANSFASRAFASGSWCSVFYVSVTDYGTLNMRIFSLPDESLDREDAAVWMWHPFIFGYVDVVTPDDKLRRGWTQTDTLTRRPGSEADTHLRCPTPDSDTIRRP